MGHNCSHHDHCDTPDTPAYRKALWIAFGLNVTMFITEILFGFFGNSTSLHADALDFFADSITYAITIFALSMTAIFRSWVGMSKGIAMLLFGIYVAYQVVHKLLTGDMTPSPFIMSWVGFAALAANLISAFVLLKFKDGDSNARSVWLCTRNDAIGNILIILAGIAIYFSLPVWLDLVAASIIASLALWGAVSVIRQSYEELKHPNNH